MTLFLHQQKTIQKALANKGCGAVFHQPGLGKTRTALEIYKSFPGHRLFVVCPLSLVNAAWRHDVEKFTSFSFSSFRENKDTDIIAVNYETLISKNWLSHIVNKISQGKWMGVLDESSRLKNHKSITTKTCLEIARFLDPRLILSGTPMPNSEMELWAQLNFIKPDILFSSFYQFRNIFFHLERNGQIGQLPKIASRKIMQELLSHGWKYAINSQRRKQLMNRIAPYTDWVKKEEAVDLPEKMDEIREVTLTQEKPFYKKMRNELVLELKNETIIAQAMLTKIMKLRQITSGFIYGDKTHCIGNSKLKELLNILEELGKEQVIIWLQFREEVYAIASALDKLDKRYATLYSETQHKDTAINEFQEGRAQYLLAHPKSAGHGLTFINCSYAIFFSLDYSWEAHTQAKDRIHRIGQKKSCTYFYLIAKGTIDEHIYKALQTKQDIQEMARSFLRENP